MKVRGPKACCTDSLDRHCSYLGRFRTHLRGQRCPFDFLSTLKRQRPVTITRKFEYTLGGLCGRQLLVDFVRITDDGSKIGNYDGICW